MRRRILIVALSLGALGGYAAGFAHLRHRCHANHAQYSTGCDERMDRR